MPNGVTAHLFVIIGDGTSLANYYGGIAYFTDLQGQLWKLNLSKSSLSDDNIASDLFGLKKSFRSEATLANDRMGFNQVGSTIVTETINGKSTSRLFNHFGTGDQTSIQRRVTTINNRIYGVCDPAFPSTGLSVSDQTVTTFTNVNNQNCSVNSSWYADVWAKTNVSSAADFQKIIGRAAVTTSMFIFQRTNQRLYLAHCM
uniref:Tfp pilus assembly protein tip-associated adhesin PilY1-like protein n=1 Tax=Polynucleobacter necessarius subsp. necessarius (strain STIR1) TaxID=452638 RepID=B1XUD1_POLNS